MARVIKRRPLPPVRPAAPPSTTPAGEPPAAESPAAPLSTVRAGADEVREKLRADLSRWLRVRRYASIKPMIGCVTCDATGHVECTHCAASGRVRLGPEAEVHACPTCQGSGSVGCVVCAGSGQVPNARRKQILWILGVGALAWVAVLWVWLGRDLLPEQRASVLHTGGGASQGPAHGGRLVPGLRNRTPGPTMGAPGAPGVGGSYASGGIPAPGGAAVPGSAYGPQPGASMPGGSAPPVGGGAAYGPAGAAVDTSHGMSWHPGGR